METFDESLRGALLGKESGDAKLFRALALEEYLAEVDAFLAKGDQESARERISRMRKYISFLTQKET